MFSAHLLQLYNRSTQHPYISIEGIKHSFVQNFLVSDENENDCYRSWGLEFINGHER